ncbi:MAG: dTDP-glucose 4,6-dehydratase [Nitrososphaerota archaeon]|jgi:dTDP-glucose 4,6-dehydratase|nr:dTDP-glucose 4,6-dehydratase [Nitrososphaerota archaeon]MDG6933023.1 dTDP-glucose 4,6-dehydratase [Nitrososphaerota archaeon]MDG6935535.1 dTDP-glucose 4,6-dehydratase [Nitrososphaerota archaeon]MDG6944251.1 dTDP-glucose 4,6-dehydratase [Nitrososphaerota archaeon]
MPRALVTGGMGFIGSNFVRHIVKNGFQTVVVDNMSYGSHPDNLNGVDVKIVTSDIRDVELMKKVVKDSMPDYIFNFAAESHVDRSISEPLLFAGTNFTGVASMLEAFRQLGAGTFVQIGTDEEYGSALSGSFKERDPLNPSSPYSASKAGGSLLALAYAKTYGLDVRVTRSSNNYGPYQFPEKLIPKTIIRAMLGLPFPVYGSGNNVRDWIHVEDNCSGIIAVVQRGKKGEVYNISANNELTNIQVVTRILNIMGKPNLIKFVEDRPGHDFRYSTDSSKLRELGWMPKISFEQGLKTTIEWYMNNREWWDKVVDEKVLSEMPWKLKF